MYKLRMCFKKGLAFGLLFMLIAGGTANAQGVPMRIVSMSPAGTEFLFALGLGERLQGATRYCDYPPEASQLPRLASMTEVNLETLLRLKTELVVMEDINSGLGAQIEKLGIKVFTLHHNSIEELLTSVEGLGRICGVPEQAKLLSRSIAADIEAVRQRTVSSTKPKVLLSIDRSLNDVPIRSLYAAGKYSFYNQLIEIAGGTNVLEENLSYARLSFEGLLALQPDLIIDVVGDHGLIAGTPSDKLQQQWNSMSGLKAVQSGRVYVLTDNAALRPGPRIAELVRTLSSFIHPERVADDVR